MSKSFTATFPHQPTKPFGSFLVGDWLAIDKALGVKVSPTAIFWAQSSNGNVPFLHTGILPDWTYQPVMVEANVTYGPA